MVSATTASPLSTYDANTLSPLPHVLRHGLVAVSFFGYLSFVSSTALFVYLTYRLARWRASGQPMKNYNQFLLLIYNLVLADIQQSLAFLLTSRWLVEDKIHVGTPYCFAEGWFVSTGDLASSVWIFAIALHTYAAIVRGYKISCSTFVVVMCLLWLFIYGMAIVGVAIHPKDYYTRAGAWVRTSSLRVQTLLTGSSAGSMDTTKLSVYICIIFGFSFACLAPSPSIRYCSSVCSGE